MPVRVLEYLRIWEINQFAYSVKETSEWFLLLEQLSPIEDWQNVQGNYLEYAEMIVINNISFWG